MEQRTLAMMAGFEQYTRKTRRAIFLEEMEQVVPWRELCDLDEPHYPKRGKGRRPVGVERMLRIYFVQQWFNLSTGRRRRNSPTYRWSLASKQTEIEAGRAIWGYNFPTS